MQKTHLRFLRFCLYVSLLSVVLILTGVSPGLAGAAGTDCVPAAQLEQDIGPEAELLDFSCSFQEWKGSECLHFYVKLQNVSESEQRFRVNIFLDNGKAVGGLLPRKTKKGLIQPGASVDYTYPVRGMNTKPEGVFLRIVTMN